MLRALLQRTTLLPSYPRNLTCTHLQIHPPAFHPSRRSFEFRPILATVFLVLLLIILLALFFALIPPSLVPRALLPAAFFISSILYLPIMLLPWLLGNFSRHHVFLGLPAASAVGCGGNSKSLITVRD